MSQAEDKKARGPVPRWKKLSIAAAAMILLAGIGMKFIGSTSREEARPAASTPQGAPLPQGAQGLVEGPRPVADPRNPGTEGTAAGNGSALGEQVSPFFISGGISFFVGLAIGAALRAFFKMALVISGIGILIVTALSYFGVIGSIDWQKAEQWLGVQIKQAEEKTAGYRQELLLSLPSAGMAGAGFVAGLKRK